MHPINQKIATIVKEVNCQADMDALVHAITSTLDVYFRFSGDRRALILRSADPDYVVMTSFVHKSAYDRLQRKNCHEIIH